MNNTNKLLANLEAEEIILGSILLDPDAIGIIAPILSPSAFWLVSHQTIYQSALELYHKRKPTDLTTLFTWLEDHNLSDSVGGQDKLAQLLNTTVTSHQVEHFAKLILEKYQRRQLLQTGQEIIDLANDTSADLEAVFDASEEKLFNVTTKKTGRFDPKSIGDSLIELFDKIGNGISPAYSTGLDSLNSLIGGLIKQDLIVVAGRPSMGKSWLGCYLANYIATNENLPVVFFSAEMSHEQLTKRFLAMHTGIDSQRLMHNQIYEEEYDLLASVLGVVSDLPIIIDDTPASQLTPAKMSSVLRGIQLERGEIGLVVLDYIQKLGDRGARNRAQAIGKYSGACKDIAKMFDLPFLVLAQINRGVEGQSNKRPSMADIKDSGDIEQDMDLGLLLYRDEYYNVKTKDAGVMEIIVGKNRNGSTGTCKVMFDPSVGKFGDFSI